MVDNISCLKCGSDKLMSNVRIVDHGYLDSKHDLSIEFDKNPDAFILKKPLKGTLLANVCGQCGHVDLSVGNPGELWELYQKK